MAVAAALGGNALVTLIKFLAFSLSGSAVMLSEAVHSLADTANQGLLLLGLRRGKRESDDEFQYGYAGERFIFGLLSAAGIFFLGCGVTIYHGVESLLHPSLPRVTWTTYAVLAASFAIEGWVLRYAYKKAVADSKEHSLWASYQRGTMDPATLAILLEDSAAVFGVVLATIAVLASSLTQNPIYDSIASIIIGLLLGGIAWFLVAENRGLLLGRAVPDDVQERFLNVLQGRASIRHVRDVKSRQISHDVFLFKAEVAFHPEFLAARLDALVTAQVLNPSPEEARALAVELSRVALQTIAIEIDAIETAVRAVIPQARHIDLELDRLRASGAPAPTTGPSAPATF